ncbi:uncharacterized protein [Henckelia pumila]|uniref:uncharacterized protein n=1 Tax=Henckelia pumila TaxID=405737 RepID=UPI003C6E2F6B
MAANSQQFGTNRNDSAPRRNNEVNATGVFPEPPQQKYDPYSNTYNPGWKDHPNMNGNPPMNQSSTQAYRPTYPPQPQRPQVPMRAINRLEAQNSSSLPSQTVVNPKENVSAITLNSGKELKICEEAVQQPVEDEDDKESKVEENDKIHEAPRALKEPRRDEGIKGIYEIFRRCDVNIPLLDAIKQVPRYAKFLKELCTVKRKHKLKGCKKFELGEQMADRSTIYPRGLLEDVLVQVDNLAFPADFYVLDMNKNDLNSPILLGRPLLKTTKSIIDVNNGTLTMEFDREVVKFHIFDTLQIPDCESVVNNLDVINHLSQEHKKVVNEDKVKEVIARPIDNFTAEIFCSDLKVPKKAKKRNQRPKITAKLHK